MKLPSVLLLSLSTASALQEIPAWARGGRAWEQYASKNKKLSAKDSEGHTWQAPLDHFAEDINVEDPTFTQHWFVDDQYFNVVTNPDAPVFLQIGGEGPMHSAPGGYMASLAANHSALLLSLEHRYYGDSIPDCIENASSTGNLEKYLTVEQALADLAAFTEYYKTEIDQRTASQPWFVFGGSYPGALASWYRTAYPDASVGSLSSSGVVNCIVDFDGFDKAVTAAIGNECSDQIRRIETAFERLVKTEKGWKQALDMFNCEDDMWKMDFFYMIADSWSMVDQYSAKSELCSAIHTDEPVSDLHLASLFAKFSNEYWGEGFCSGGFYNTVALSDPDRWEPNARSWRWQTCYQVSYFNTAPKSGSLRNKFVNLEYHLRQCAAIFGRRIFPSSIDMNKKYGGAEPYANKVFYSDFSDDPWQRASVDYQVSVDQPYHLTTCDDCGHCLDLHEPSDEDPQALKDGRLEFEKYLGLWLEEGVQDLRARASESNRKMQ